jgi:hypothetical protein
MEKMTVQATVREAFADDDRVVHVLAVRTTMHGEKAVSVVVTLNDYRRVTGTFTTESKPGFGGVDFSEKKDPAALMIHKVKSVLEGTYDRN